MCSCLELNSWCGSGSQLEKAQKPALFFPSAFDKWQQGMYSDKTVTKNVGRNNNVCNGLKVGLKLKVFYSLLAFFEAKLNVTCVVV